MCCTKKKKTEKKNTRSSDLEARLCFVFLPPRLSGASSFCTGLFHVPRLLAALEALSKRGIELHLEQQRQKMQLTWRRTFFGFLLKPGPVVQTLNRCNEWISQLINKSDKRLLVRTCSKTSWSNTMKVKSLVTAVIWRGSLSHMTQQYECQTGATGLCWFPDINSNNCTYCSFARYNVM